MSKVGKANPMEVAVIDKAYTKAKNLAKERTRTMKMLTQAFSNPKLSAEELLQMVLGAEEDDPGILGGR